MGKYNTGWIIVWLVGFLGWIVATIFLGLAAFLLGFIVLALSFLALVYFVLAKANLFWTFVNEGTAKIILKGEEFHKCLIAWKGYTFKITRDGGSQSDEKDNWEVVRGEEPRHTFGLQWVGLWPIYGVLDYQLHWTHYHQDGTIKEHDEFLDYVLLTTDNYATDYPLSSKEPAEDINGMPMGIKILWPGRIINPYEAIMRYRELFTILSSVFRPMARTFLGKYRYKEDLITMTAGKGITEVQTEGGVPDVDIAKPGDGLRRKLWDEFIKFLGPTALRYGVKTEDSADGLKIFGFLLAKYGVDILDIDPDPSYRELTTLRYRAEREKEKAIIDSEARMEVASRTAKQKALETAGMQTEAEQILVGKGYTPEDARKYAREYVIYWKGAESGVIRDWRFPDSGGSGIYSEIAKAAAIIESVKEVQKAENQSKEKK